VCGQNCSSHFAPFSMLNLDSGPDAR
jgi:hypothetical protein